MQDRGGVGALPAIPKRMKLPSVMVLSIIAVAILYLFNPASSAFYGKCPFFAMTGLHCPGCGTLRALHQLLHMNLAGALHMNPLTVFSIPFLGYAFVSRISNELSGKPQMQLFIPAAGIWALLAVIVVFWILRNIPAYPFSLLAPIG
jgi:hypothetical protein